MARSRRPTSVSGVHESSSTRNAPSTRKVRRWSCWRKRPATASTERRRRPSRATSQRRARSGSSILAPGEMERPRREQDHAADGRCTHDRPAARRALRDHCAAAAARDRLHRHDRRLAEHGDRGRGARRSQRSGRDVFRELARDGRSEGRRQHPGDEAQRERAARLQDPRHVHDRAGRPDADADHCPRRSPARKAR